MERKRLVLLISLVFLLLITSFFVYSQVSSSKNNYITQAEFINMLINILGLEDQLPVAVTLSDKVALLKAYDIAPLGGWDLEKVLSKGDASVVICRILGIVPIGTKLEDYVKELIDRGIMTPGDAESPFALSDLTASINMAATTPGVFTPSSPPWTPGPPTWSPGNPGWPSGPPPWHVPASPSR